MTSKQAIPASQLYRKLKKVGKGAYGSVYKGYVIIAKKKGGSILILIIELILEQIKSLPSRY